MYVVTVEFTAVPAHRSELGKALQRQAANSLSLETECHTFLVSTDANDGNRFFLYEEYTDRAAFDAHLASDHFAEFNARVTPWVASKKVETWVRPASC